MMRLRSFIRRPARSGALLAGLLCAGLAGLLPTGHGAAVEPGPVTDRGQGGSAYARLLDRHVGVGQIDGIRLHVVDYEGLATDPDYEAALEDLAAARPGSLGSDDAKMAFWINAYNLLAIKTIVDRYPIASIRDGGNFLFPIWKKDAGEVGGRSYSLDEIEHGILRRDFAEPRIHFALVCASVSCPDLRREPFVAGRLDAQFDDQVRSFLSHRGKGLAPGPDEGGARVSKIFDWFEDDFAPVGGVAAFILARADSATRKEVEGLTDADLSYLSYDWSLNDRARSVVP
jgi:hypothetical protein